MKYGRKILSVLMVLSLVLVLSFAGARADVIYETKTKEIVTSGVILETITRFADEGWQKIYVLRVNLDDPNVMVDTLTNKESIKNLTNVKALAESYGAVAAINGGFFSWLPEAGKAVPEGPIIQSGEVLSIDSEYNRYNDSMATISIDNENNVFYDFWKSKIDIYAPDGSMARVTQYNKPIPDDRNDLSIWSRRWSQYSLGVSEKTPDIVEMVVDDKTVIDIRHNLPAVSIPQNGYVVIGRGSHCQYLLDNFQIGDTVNFTASANLDLNNIDMAITGSAILVKEGRIPSKFSYDIAGAHPRTAIGSSKSGKELILVAVDGRQASSRGMNQTELANLMLSLGAYNAANLDGGGSTSLVSRIPVGNQLQIVNSPSDGSLRNIATAIGVFSVCPPSSLEGLVIDTGEPNIFSGTSLNLSVKGYDTYFNPLAVNPGKIEWSVSGVDGSFDGNVFYPKSSGIATLTAKVGEITGTATVRVLERVDKLILDIGELYLPLEGSHTFSVRGCDNNGYSANINPSDVNWSVSGNIGKFENSIFTATDSGIGYIDAKLGDVHAYCAVSVALENLHTADNFETLNGTFLSSPPTLPGGYELSDKEKLTGSYAGKLSYDFSSLEGTRAAYLVFLGDGIDLNKNTTELSMWVYNPHENSNWLRAEVIDANGKKHLISFSNGMDWTGWKRVFAPLDNINSPAKLTRLYLVQINPVPESGYIYIDNLGFKQAQYTELKKGDCPEDISLKDSADKKTIPTEGTQRFSVIADVIGKPQNMLQKLLGLRFSEKIKADKAMGKTYILKEIKSFNSSNAGTSRFITLDTSQKSIRTSAKGQWQWFLDELNSHTGDNIFIFMQNPPSVFTDPLEANLFKDILVEQKDEKGKNVWVFHSGNADTCTAQNGIKYFSTRGMNLQGLNPTNAGSIKYIEITVNNRDVTYQYNSVFGETSGN